MDFCRLPLLQGPAIESLACNWGLCHQLSFDGRQWLPPIINSRNVMTVSPSIRWTEGGGGTLSVVPFVTNQLLELLLQRFSEPPSVLSINPFPAHSSRTLPGLCNSFTEQVSLGGRIRNPLHPLLPFPFKTFSVESFLPNPG